MLGRSVLALVPPDQHPEAVRVMEQIWAGGRVPPYEAIRLRKDGGLVSVGVNPWPVRNAAGRLICLAAIYTDLTERRRAERALREREELLRNIIAHIPCGVFWKDRDSVYLGCNQVVSGDHGFASPDAVVGLTDFDLCTDPAEAEVYRTCDRRLVEAGEAARNA